ncbi:MAG: hypothetical protein LBR79_02820 [Oscillospiraceae bacterium]|jgi:hypothetical protein|nr:hypothetical protein [Oscillospiraceae bacterium]
MYMDVQNLPAVSANTIVMDESITNARHAYNLLQKNGLMSDDGENIYATKGRVEVLCNKDFGVIPSLLASVLNHPSACERAVYYLVLCQYAKSKFMSAFKGLPKTKELHSQMDELEELQLKTLQLKTDDDELEELQSQIDKLEKLQSKIDKLTKDFSKAYMHYLQVKDYTATTKMSKRIPPEISYDKGYMEIKKAGYTQTTTVVNNNDLIESLKQINGVGVEARTLFSAMKKEINLNISLTNEAIKDFADNASKIAMPIAVAIEEKNNSSIFSKSLRYFFSFKGDWANEEAILSISKLSN